VSDEISSCDETACPTAKQEEILRAACVLFEGRDGHIESRYHKDHQKMGRRTGEGGCL
jgi:hypothetical protein